MSGSLIGGIVGAVIGFSVGMPGLGFAIGSALGGAIAPGSLPDQYGPRLSDLKPQSSEYGRPIPVVYGAIGMGGNVIWAGDLIEVKTETQTDSGGGGGKGGGPTQTTILYSYYANFAVAICEGTKNLGRVWAGPERRLIFDVKPLTNTDTTWTIRFYQGTETQLPDPLMESILGVGKVPAYRGTCYLVFENYPVIDDGNRIPFIFAEVGDPGDIPDAPVVYLGESAHVPTFADMQVQGLVDPETGDVWSLGPHELSFYGTVGGYPYEPLRVVVNSDVTKTQIAKVIYDFPDIRAYTGATMVYVPARASNTFRGVSYPGNPAQILVIASPFSVFTDYVITIDVATKTVVKVTEALPHGISDLQQAAYNPVRKEVVYARYALLMGTNPDIRTNATMSADFFAANLIWVSSGGVGPVPSYLSSYDFFEWKAGPIGYDTAYTWCDELIVTKQYLLVVSSGLKDMIHVHKLSDNTWVSSYVRRGGIQFWDEDRQTIVMVDGSLNIRTVVVTAGVLETSFTPYTTTKVSVPADFTPSANGLTPSTYTTSGIYYKGYYIIGAGEGGGTGTALFLVDPSSLIAQKAFAYETGGTTGNYNLDKKMVGRLMIPASGGNYLLSFDYNHVKRLYFGGDGVGGTTLAVVVADLSRRAGLEASQINVTALTDIVDGYAIARQTSVRDSIDSLRPAYYFDGVESSGVVKYVKRGGPLAAVIPDSDLAAREGAGAGVEPLSTRRQMDRDLPRTLNINYLLKATIYSTATKISKRLIGGSGSESTMDMPMVLTDTKAQQIADVNLHVAWVHRLSYTFTLPKKYAFLEPTDVVGIKGYTMRITKVTAAPHGHLAFEAVHDDANLYSPIVIVTETPPVVQITFVPGVTVLELM